jgi:hypothetical protein
MTKYGLGNILGDFHIKHWVTLLGHCWVRIQKPVVTYDVVTCDKKAVCPDLFATLPNVFHHINFTISIKHWRCNF